MKKEDKAEKCVAWLHAYLGDRTLPCEEVRNAAYAAGIFQKRPAAGEGRSFISFLAL